MPPVPTPFDDTLAGDPGAILAAVEQAASGRIDNGKRQQRQQWMASLREIEATKLEKLEWVRL